MKKIAMMMAALTIAAAGFGQHRHPMHRHGQRGGVLKETLDLDSAQFATIKGINRKYHEQARTLRFDTTRSADQKQKEFKSLRDARQKEISGVLTPEQNKKLDAVKAERKEKREQAIKARKQRRDDQLKSRLSITDEQLGKMKKAREESFSQAQKEYEKKMKSILNDEQFKKWKEEESRRKERKR